MKPRRLIALVATRRRLVAWRLQRRHDGEDRMLNAVRTFAPYWAGVLLLALLLHRLLAS